VATDLPWMKFYPADWLKDDGLCSVSWAARGVWAAMMARAHLNGRRRGYLDNPDGSAKTPEQITSLIGGERSEVVPLIAELEAAGVFSRDEAGVIYSRRIVADEHRRQACAVAGRRGGNPKLKPGDKRTLKGTVKAGDKPGVKPIRGSEYRDKDIKDIAGLPPGEHVIPTPEKKDRPRNPLFDAVSEVTGADAKLVGSLIGKVSAALAEAGYGPDDVRDFGRRYLDLCPWARGERTRPEPAELQKHIGKLRAAPAVAPAKPVDVSNLF
jgi:hypothetical protein